MPGGGLIWLIAYGTQNVILSGNPDMTYFYKVVKKYTHFSLETISKSFDGTTVYPYDRTAQVSTQVDRKGDLVNDMYVSFTLPPIFSKHLGTAAGNIFPDPSQGNQLEQEFQWINAVGALAIDTVYVTIGPNKIQEFTGEYLMAKAMLDLPKDAYEKWQRLVGDIPELNHPAGGIYGNPNVFPPRYPTVYGDKTNTTQNNNPSIPGYTVYVPIPFWFTEEGQALPLVGLQVYPVTITVVFRPARELYTTLDANGFRMAPGYSVDPTSLQANPNRPVYNNIPDTDTQIRHFLTDVNVNPDDLNRWTFNPTLYTTYVFLPENEQKIFATTPLSYVIREVTHISFNEIVNHSLLDLYVHNPITRIILLPRRSDSIYYRNKHDNLTNWWDWPNRPKQITQSATGPVKYSSGVTVPGAQVDIIASMRLLCDGNEIQEVNTVQFFTDVTQYKYLSGGANRRIPVYSFELHSPTPQPAGSINSSRINKLQLDVDIFPLGALPTYIYTIDVYVENINFFNIESGMGSKKYAT
jgi:hypothetical protein